MKPLILFIVFAFAVSCVLAQGAATFQQTVAEGARWMGQGRHDQALKAYQAALDLAETDDERAQALMALANLHRVCQDPETELECLQQVVALPAVAKMTARNARRQMLQLYQEQGDFGQARAVGQALLADATNVDDRIGIQITLAQIDLQDEKPAEAVKRLQALLPEAKEGRRRPDIYSALISALILTNRAREASDLAAQALKEFPERIDLLLQVADTLREQDHANDAAALLQEALTAQPQQQELLRALYDTYRGMGQVKRLTDWLGKQAKGEGQELWLGHLARVYEWEGQPAQALDVYQQLVALKPQDVQFLQMAAQTALRVNDYQRAGEWLQQALTQQPDDETLMTLLGEADLRQGKLQPALGLWRQATGYDPKDAQSVRKLGSVLMRYELYEAALEAYRQGREAAGDRTAFALNMAAAHEKLAQWPEAAREYTVALAVRDRMQTSASSAAQQLYHLAEDEAARPEVLAALQAARQGGDLPPEGLGALLYAQALQGQDVSQLLDASLPPGQTGPAQYQTLAVLLSIAQRLEARQLPELALPFYERLMGSLTGEQAVSMARRIADLRLQAGDWRAALAALQAALKTTEATGQAGRQRAALALQLGDVLLRYARQPTEAMGAYEIVLKEGPATSRPAGGAATPEPNGGPDDIRPLHTTSLLAQWGQADALFALGEYGQALEEYRRLGNLHVEDEPAAGEPPRVLMMDDMNQVYLPNLGGPGISVRQVPGEDYVALQQAEALLRQGKLDEAGQQFHKLAAEHADSTYANDALERVLLTKRLQADHQAAETYVQAVKAWAKGGADEALQASVALEGGSLADLALMLEAEIRVWQGDTPAAIQAYERVVAEHADAAAAPRAAFTAAMLQQKSDQAAARSRLQALIEKFPDATEAEEARIVLQAWEK